MSLIMDEFESAALRRETNIVLNIMKKVIPEWENSLDLNKKASQN